MNREIDFDLDEALFSYFSEINDEISKKDISIKTKDLIEIERLRAMILDLQKKGFASETEIQGFLPTPAGNPY